MSVKFGLVILNFLTYDDTYDSIISLFNNLEVNEDLKIYIVDNGTNYNNYIKLQKKLNDIKHNYNIIYLESLDNVGFANGMNIGIHEAKKDKCDLIICSNNDILYIKKIDFNIFVKIYNNDNKIATIGPNLVDLEGKEQNPYIENKINWNNKKKFFVYKLFYTNVLGYILFYLNGYRTFFKKLKNKDSFNKKSRKVYALHGSWFVLTPAYFKYYNNLDPNTFLYSEELILAERLKSKSLSMYFYGEMKICHKEDSSTNEMIGTNFFKKMNFNLRENYKSRKYFLGKYIYE